MVAFLPGEDRPLLKRGMPLRLEVQGYRYAYQQLTVDSVGDEVVGPAEARRYLGDEIADAVQFTGPVVKVEAHLAVAAPSRRRGRCAAIMTACWRRPRCASARSACW